MPYNVSICANKESHVFEYDLIATDPGCAARLGCLHTPHGDVQTPIFMPVGTAAAVKGIFHRDVRDEARMRFVLFDCK